MIFWFDNLIIFFRIKRHMNKIIATTTLALGVSISGGAAAWMTSKSIEQIPVHNYWNGVCRKHAEDIAEIIWHTMDERIDGLPTELFSSYRVILTPIDWNNTPTSYPVRQVYLDKLIWILSPLAPDHIIATEKVVYDGKDRILLLQEWTTALNLDVRFTKYRIDIDNQSGRWEYVFDCENRVP